MPEFVVCRTCKTSIPYWEWATGCPQCKTLAPPSEAPTLRRVCLCEQCRTIEGGETLSQKLEALAQKFRDGSWILELERDLTGGSL